MGFAERLNQRMLKAGEGVEYYRTCRQCGAQWTLSFAEHWQEQLAASKSVQRGLKMQAAGEAYSSHTSIFRKKRHRAKAAAIREGQATSQVVVQATSQCPSCGSTSFIEGQSGELKVK